MYFLMHPLKNLLKLQWTFIKYETLFKKEVEGGAVPNKCLINGMPSFEFCVGNVMVL